MTNKSIIFTAPKVAEIVDTDVPRIADDEVLVKLEYSTISSGTERANLIGDANTSVYSGPSVSFPRRCGYSSAGIVVEVGNRVSSVKIGDRVACSWTKYAQYFALKESTVYKMDDSISFSEGSLIHIATFPMAAIRKCRVEIGESAIVMGLGILGLIAVEILRAAGAAPIIAVDPIESKRQKALEVGADYALDPFAKDFTERVKEITDGGANVAIEITGKGQGLDMVLDCMKRFGRVALLGCTRSSDFSIDYYRKVHGPGITLIGAHTRARPLNESSGGWWTERDDANAILKLISYGRLNLSTLVEEVYSPDEAPEVFTRLANDASFPITQFEWSKMK